MAMYRAAALWSRQIARGGGREKRRWARGVGARAATVQGVADAHHHISSLPPGSYPLTAPTTPDEGQLAGKAVAETAMQEATLQGLSSTFDKSSSAITDEKIGGQATQLAFRIPLINAFPIHDANGAAKHMKVSDEDLSFNLWKEAASFLEPANLRGRAGPICPMATMQSPRRGYSSRSSELENQVCRYDEKIVLTKLDAIDDSLKKELSVIGLDIKQMNDKLSKLVLDEWMSINIKGRPLNIAGVISLAWCAYEAISKFLG